MRPPASHTLTAATTPFQPPVLRRTTAPRRAAASPRSTQTERLIIRLAQVVIAMTDRSTRPPVALRQLPIQLYAARDAARPSRHLAPDALSRPQP